MHLIKSLQIGWLSPKRIEQLSFGEITSHKILNTRTFKPELGGLFDPRIFGPFSNYECYCGKYKGKQNKDQVCERCEVLITEKNVQRWRMGHINLVSPVTNISLFKTISTNLSKILDISTKNLEDIIYFRSYVVIDNGTTNLLSKGEVLEKKVEPLQISGILNELIESGTAEEGVVSEAKNLKKEIEAKKDDDAIFLEDYLNFLSKHKGLKILTGTEAFHELLKGINVKEYLETIKKGIGKESFRNSKIRFLQSFEKTNVNLEWMIMNKLPVVACGLRPVTKLKDDDTIATTQINNLYRRVILINDRLKYYLDLNKNLGVFFSEIIHNEKRRLQKAIDQLIYGSSKQQPEIKSLLQSLSGKEGILRRYSLGKRVDYSARSVIVPNPNLLLNQIGVPVKMALVLFKPFIVQKLLKEKIVFTVREAENLISSKNPVIFSYLNEIIHNHPILANRAPSLHRLSLQGFFPKLTLGKAIELHPLITTALNADFDGDQIAIHLPLSKKSQDEARDNILSIHHTIDPKNGQLIDIPTQDIILGIYYLTKEEKSKSSFQYFEKISDIWKCYEKGLVGIHDVLIVPSLSFGRKFEERSNFVITTLGKIALNQIMPSDFNYYVNDSVYFCEELRSPRTFTFKEIENEWTFYSPARGWKKKKIISFLNLVSKMTERREMVKFLDRLKKISFDYVTSSGISISPFELDNVVPSKEKMILDYSEKAKLVEDLYDRGFYSYEEKKWKTIEIWQECKDNLQKQMIEELEKKKETSFYNIWESGARASSENLVQLFAMRGHTINYLGEIIESPITSSLWGGLSPFEFFVSVYGAVKGMIDIALKTGVAGDLTRRLVESSQGISIITDDCGSKLGLKFSRDLSKNSLQSRSHGRYLLEDVLDENGNIILGKDTLILDKESKVIEKQNIEHLEVRSPITCRLADGICQKCYGTDLSNPEKLVKIGTAVGIIAAQSLGEPGTQLTMNTFHTGGIAGDEDITQGLPKVKQIFDNIKPKKEEKAVLSRYPGKIIKVADSEVHQLTEEQEQPLVIYEIGKNRSIKVNEGDEVKIGEKLTNGRVDLEEFLEITGRDITQEFIKEEIRKVYFFQGIEINEKHIEIFSKRMLSKVLVTDGGDSEYLSGDVESYQFVMKENERLVSEGKKKISYQNMISSLKDLASQPSSFLAGISFQNTLKSLVNYSLYQPIDYLKGSKESLIAGQLIPVGVGLTEREKYMNNKKLK